MPFTFNKSSSGNVEVFEEGKRIATATPQVATQQYGYNAPVTPQGAPQATQTSQAVSLPKKEPFVLSSEQGLDIDTKNRNALFGIQKGVEEAQKGIQLAQQQKAADIKAGEPLAFQPGTATPQLTPTGSPVTVAMANQINQASQQGIIDNQKLTDLKKKETEAMSAIQQAQAAADAGDPIGLNTYTKLYQEQKKQFEDSMTKYLKDIENLRAERIKLAVPGQREIEVKRQLNEIRTGQKKFELELEESKLSEFMGAGTLGFAQGRVQEKEFRASFRRREMALQEQSLLMDLGLEQELRGYQAKSVEQQLDDFKTDFELKSKIEDKLSKMENDILDKAQELRKEDQKTLSSILDDLKGSAFEDLSPEGQTQLNNLARSTGLPIDLVKEGLRAQKAREVFEQGIKTEKEKRAEETAERAEKRLGLAEEAAARVERKKAQEPEVKFSSTQISKGAAVAGIPIDDFRQLDIDTKNYFINNEGEIKARKKIIDEAKIAKEDPSAIEQEISDSLLPNVAKDTLVKYLKQVFPEMGKDKNIPWWRRLTQ